MLLKYWPILFSSPRRQGRCHGQATIAQRTLGTNQTVVTSRTTQTKGGSSTHLGSQSINRDLVCIENGNSLGIFATRNGVRFWDDVLASSSRLACRWCLAKSLEGTARRTWLGGRHRLDNVGDRQLQRPRSFWGVKTGPNPTDRGKNGSKRHVITDGNGIPLAIEHSGANVHDSEVAIPLVDAIPPIKTANGGRRKRPDETLADRAYDAEDKIRRELRRRRIKPLVAKRNTEHGSGLGKYRYVVEVCFDWLFNWRRLRVRYEKRDDIHDAFLIIGCCMICWNRILEFC